jgi:7-cyano-7-deazaguanine synthase
VLLFSGGLDSTALAWSLRPALLLTVDYGQRSAEGEIRSARAVASELRLPHEVATLRPPYGTGELLSDDVVRDDVPAEWWPFRNQLLVTLGAALAATRGLGVVIVGTVSGDGRYADGKPPFLASMNTLMALQEHPVRIEAPALHQTSAELVREAGLPARVASLTHSCSRAPRACGDCGSCVKSREVFAEAFSRG